MVQVVGGIAESVRWLARFDPTLWSFRPLHLLLLQTLCRSSAEGFSIPQAANPSEIIGYTLPVQIQRMLNQGKMCNFLDDPSSLRNSSLARSLPSIQPLNLKLTLEPSQETAGLDAP